jgi:hypothetical protein
MVVEMLSASVATLAVFAAGLYVGVAVIAEEF